MTLAFDSTTIQQLTRRFKEPEWLVQLRLQAWEKHQALPWPHPSDDIWRRTDVSLLDPRNGFSLSEPSLHQTISLSDTQFADVARPLGNERLYVRADEAWITRPKNGAAVVEDLSEALQRDGEPIRAALEADGFTEAEQKLATVNAAFHHDDVVVSVPANSQDVTPIRLVHLFSACAKQAVFPLTVVTIGEGSVLTLIDEYVGLEQEVADPSLVHARVELVIEPGAQVRYVRLQRWGGRTREFLLQRVQLGRGATLTMANLTLGASLSKAHIITRLTGAQASTKLYGFVFGHANQHVDQHTLQDHLAPNTLSDLEYRAALQDSSRMVYTGLIRIAAQAVQTDAYQSNHNLLLSRQAQAETIPMLEILADDVKCKHGASVGPIDDEQLFYLMSRGITRQAAERLVVMGFIEPVIQQVPFEPLQERLRREIEGSLRSDEAAVEAN